MKSPIVRKGYFVTTLSIDEVLALLQDHKGYKNAVLVDDNQQIFIKKGMSYKSYGEKIILKLYQQKKEQNYFMIISQPLLRTTFMDSGKNNQNIIEIIRLLERAEDLA